MKVVLLQDVKKLGKKGQVVEVTPGFASNFLIPKKQAVLATDTVVKQVRKEELEKHQSQQRELQKFAYFKQKLSGRTLTVEVAVGKQGQIYGGVDGELIVKQVNQLLGAQYSKRDLTLPHGIKALGVFDAALALNNAISVGFKILLTAKKA